MILSGLGIALRRIEAHDIELVRQWRNQEEIRSQMFVSDTISASDQRLWFNKIDNCFNYFFIIERDKVPLGVIFAKDVDLETRVGEGGIFIGDLKYWNTDIPARASILLLYFCFEHLGITQSWIKLKKDNPAAINFNKSLGYQWVENQGMEVRMQLSAQDFFSAPIVKKILNLPDVISHISLIGIPSDKNLPIINDYLLI